MTAGATRAYIAEAAILAAVVIGGWFLLVDRNQSTLANLEAERARLTADTPGPDISSETLGVMSSEANAASRIADEVDRRNRFALDASRLYDTFMSYADDRGVTVHRLDPTAERPGMRDAAFQSSRVSMSVEAPFAQIADFVDGLQQFSAFVRPIAVTARAGAREGTCTADIELEILQFHIAQTIATASEDAQQ